MASGRQGKSGQVHDGRDILEIHGVTNGPNPVVVIETNHSRVWWRSVVMDRRIVENGVGRVNPKRNRWKLSSSRDKSRGEEEAMSSRTKSVAIVGKAMSGVMDFQGQG